MTTKQSLSMARGFSCVGIAAVVLGLLLPLAATDIPSYGDGAEMVMAATVGSLVHPPGFPLFCQLNDWLIGTIGGSPYHLIATASVVEHALAALLFFGYFHFG